MQFLKNLSIYCFLLFSLSINAQPFFQWDNSIQVKLSSSYIKNPWAGGLNFVQVSEIDMNMDGKKDLFVFDRTGNMIRTFINNGTVGTVDYTYDPFYETSFPKINSWALLADYNCDGKEDIYCYSSLGGGFDIYKNTSTSTILQFTKIVTKQQSNYSPPSGSPSSLYMSPVDIPAISDIDNDGDLDIITFAIGGTRMEYHKNMSMELFGTCDSLRFDVANHCWGYAAENALSNDYTIFDTCSTNVSSPEFPLYEAGTREPVRHAGSCQLCLDLDADGDKDFVAGDISFRTLTMLTNGGTPTDGSFVAIDTAFPSNNSSTTAINLTIYPCAFYVDVNFDGAKDLIVSPSAPNVSENFNSVVFYSNSGTTNFPIFQHEQNNLLQDNMIDVGEGAYPAFFDYDNDGLKDMFIGNYKYYGTSSGQNKIAQFRNIGTLTSPEFQLVTRDYDGYDGSSSPLSALAIANPVPAFGDMDNDGDADMFIGAYDGKIHYFKNIASSGALAHFVLTSANFKNSSGRVIDVGDFASPQIADIDGDGQNDLIIGARNGKLAYYNYSGSTTIPILDSVSHFFGGVQVSEPLMITGYSYPFIFKQGSVSKLLVGSESGYMRFYDNIDANLTGTFNLVDSAYLNIWQGTRVAPTGADMNNDGFMDLLIGNYQGGVSYFKGVSSISVAEIEDVNDWKVDVFPNPANDYFTIKIIGEENASYSFELYNLLGQSIFKKRITSNAETINTESIPQGVYICKVYKLSDEHTKMNFIAKRIVITR
ncbi:MAG: VCBS repeat-containing protein [Bacteroidetes bacterium]|nr:VCBS repeat-containing protein [Bacteroidota bacterium]